MTRTALVHEWLEGRTGSEKTFEQIALAFPDADLFALSQEPGVPFDFGDRSVTTSMLDRRLFRDRRAATLPLMPLAWDRLDVPDDPYDLVITSSHAFANLARPTKHASAVLCYCHTPARYLWVPELDARVGRLSHLLGPARSVLRRIDLRGAKRVTSFAVNSAEIAGRVKQFYGRESIIIPPPVETDFFTPGDESPHDASDIEFKNVDIPADFILAMSRFVPYKRLDLAIETAAAVGMPIVVAGSGADENRLREIAHTSGAAATFVISPSQDELRALYQRAQLLIFPAFEDFGIVPVEAQACGTPVVALAAGGTLDSIQPDVTGTLATEQTLASFVDATTTALADLASDELTAKHCRANALEFSEQRFRERIAEWAAEYGG